MTLAISLPPSMLGQGAADIISQLNRLRKGVAQKTKLDLKLATFNSFDAVLNALKKGDADIAWISPYYYTKMKMTEWGGKAAPLVTLTVSGSQKSRTCLYVRKSSDIRDLDGLVSSRVAFSDLQQWVMLNVMFDDQKYPFPPFDFFQSHEEITRESAAYALHLKEIDAMVLEEPYIAFIEKNIKGFRKEIYPVACAKPLTNAVIVYRKDIGEAKARKIKQIFLTMHKDSAFKSVHKFYSTANARWGESKSGMYADWMNIFLRASRKGWVKDYGRLERVRGSKPE